MTSTQNLSPGDRVTFTSYGRNGTQTGTLNGIMFVGGGYGTVAHIRTDTGTRHIDRVEVDQ